jgi:hypothetical protein
MAQLTGKTVWVLIDRQAEDEDGVVIGVFSSPEKAMECLHEQATQVAGSGGSWHRMLDFGAPEAASIARYVIHQQTIR